MDEGAFRIGTRGSQLARRQARIVADELADRRYEVEVVEVSTAGDRIREELIHRLGKTGAFVRDLDERVLAGDLDAAVHSLKDMPTEIPEGLVVAAIPPRGDPRDVLVTPDGTGFEDLPPGATVGTGSLRRRAQLGRLREDVTVEAIRGNVDTRIEKLLSPHLQAVLDELDGEERETWLGDRSALEKRALDRAVDTDLDALVLSAAGLDRTGLVDAVETAPISLEKAVPSAGQGAIAVTMRDSDRAEAINQVLDDPPIRVAATVERTVLAGLGGGCIAPIGVHAVVQGDVVHTRVQVLSLSGDEEIAMTRDLPIERYLGAAEDLVEELAAQGADDLIKRAVAAAEESA